jgi:predicted AAA+ superfamily ATPase
MVACSVSPYVPRIVDTELDELVSGLPAIAQEGAKGVGKTATARRRAATVILLDRPEERALLDADPARLTRGTPPILLDEWQRHPPAWDLVRRAVDDGAEAGRFLLTGSAAPIGTPVHSGAGRIVRLRVRPLSLAERNLTPPTVSLRDLLTGDRPPIAGAHDVPLPQLLESLLASGYPAIATAAPRSRRALLDGYLNQIVEREFAQLGYPVRRPQTLRAWLAAYAAATATTTSYNRILAADTPGEGSKPAKTTTIAYREVLEHLYVLDPLPAWVPTRNALARLAQAPKHHLADPALAAQLLGVGHGALLAGEGPEATHLRFGDLTGRLFESLVALSVRTYAQAAEARTFHFRTHGGDREVDLLVERDDGRVLAIEVKLAPTVGDDDVAHLHWLRNQLGNDLLDAIVVTTGRDAYRRRDGVGVVPAVLLGP